MVFASLPSKVISKLGQGIYRHRVSEPFLSGDLFAYKSDYSIPNSFQSNPLILEKVRSAKVIFCKGDYVADFLEAFGKYLVNKILIVGNSDLDWHEFPMNLAPRIKGVFLQNSFIVDSRIHTLPIGIENYSYFRNGRMRNFSQRLSWQVKDDKILVGPFSPTHPIRQEILQSIKASPRVNIALNQNLEPIHYAKLASKFGYVASPRGNGEDTHRLWESLYRGCAPVILKTKWSSNLRILNLPIMEIEEWENSALEQLPPFRSFDPLKLESLWWPHWSNRIKKLI